MSDDDLKVLDQIIRRMKALSVGGLDYLQVRVGTEIESRANAEICAFSEKDVAAEIESHPID